MESPVDKYQEFVLELLEEERVEDAKVLLSVVGEIAIVNKFKDRAELWRFINVGKSA